ncbi:hypothetical protein D3C72_2325490 [compost metagenome]
MFAQINDRVAVLVDASDAVKDYNGFGAGVLGIGNLLVKGKRAAGYEGDGAFYIGWIKFAEILGRSEFSVHRFERLSTDNVGEIAMPDLP